MYAKYETVLCFSRDKFTLIKEEIMILPGLLEQSRTKGRDGKSQREEKSRREKVREEKESEERRCRCAKR